MAVVSNSRVLYNFLAQNCSPDLNVTINMNLAWNTDHRDADLWCYYDMNTLNLILNLKRRAHLEINVQTHPIFMDDWVDSLVSEAFQFPVYSRVVVKSDTKRTVYTIVEEYENWKLELTDSISGNPFRRPVDSICTHGAEQMDPDFVRSKGNHPPG